VLLAYVLSTGITSGALYSLVAIGLVICYRTSGHLNFSHGELFMVGGYFAFSLHVMWGLPYIPSLVLAVVGGALLGLACDRAVFRPLIKAPPMAMVMATVALSFVLKGIARYIWGGQGEFVPFPPIASPAPVEWAGFTIFPQQAVVFAAGLLAMALITLVFRYTRAGKSMQAVAESQRAAYLVGIRVERVYSATWAAAAALAAFAAVLMAPLTQLTPDIGFGLLLKALAATVLGGLGNLPGAVIGGFLIGLSESFAAAFIDSRAQDVSAFVAIMVVLAIRPTGLFGARSQREV